MPTVSIIANFYKSEKYIPKLINSVIAQTYQDWELICVNDCSPMDDLRVINQYATIDNRIVVIDNEQNLGISKAKFEGIKYAKGKYLMFIDGDDWLEPKALQKCIEPAERFDCDMILMSHQKVLHKFFFNYKQRSINNDINRKIEQPELFDKYYINFFGIHIFSVTYWGKLIRKDAFDRANMLPSEQDYSEDLIFNMYLFPHLRSIYMIDYIGYNWRWGGITSGGLKDTQKRVIKLLTFVLDFYDRRMNLLDQNNYQKAKKYLTIELVNYLVINVAKIAKSSECNEELGKLINSYIPQIRRLI